VGELFYYLANKNLLIALRRLRTYDYSILRFLLSDRHFGTVVQTPERCGKVPHSCNLSS
jgi:hypothetical protein